MARRIFISYRRLDSKAEARSICQRLEKAFGKKNIFIDVDSINPGEDFRSLLAGFLEKSNTMIVVIGPRWLDLLKSSGPAASETASDFVQLEVASAIKRNIPIVPVLVDGATMPDEQDLPDDLKPLAFRQAFSVRHDSFPRDMQGLEQELNRVLPPRASLKAALVAVLLLLLGAATYNQFWSSQPVSAKAYSNNGNFACFNDAKFPVNWRGEAALCAHYGCNFGKMSRDACLALGAEKGSKTVIHGNPNTTRTNECWLQHSCGDLRPHSEFTLFKL